jgi:hypothetical protein
MIQITLPFRQHGVTCRCGSNRFKNGPRFKGTDVIYLPGEMEREHQEAALRDGMRLQDYVIVNLLGLAEDVGMLPQLEILCGGSKWGRIFNSHLTPPCRSAASRSPQSTHPIR